MTLSDSVRHARTANDRLEFWLDGHPRLHAGTAPPQYAVADTLAHRLGDERDARDLARDITGVTTNPNLIEQYDTAVPRAGGGTRGPWPAPAANEGFGDTNVGSTRRGAGVARAAAPEPLTVELLTTGPGSSSSDGTPGADPDRGRSGRARRRRGHLRRPSRRHGHRQGAADPPVKELDRCLHVLEVIGIPHCSDLRRSRSGRLGDGPQPPSPRCRRRR